MRREFKEMSWVTYKILQLEDIERLGLPFSEADLSTISDSERLDLKMVNYLYECEDDTPVRYIAADGGEPEDQTFTRDWSWVPRELEAAYLKGLAAGRKGG